LMFHRCSSNHSQNWLLPLFWIFVVGSLTYGGLTYWGVVNFAGECFFYQIEHIFKYISIFNFDDSLKKLPVIFVLNKVLLGYLYYQFLTAIRKDTRK
jgi:hypothetical protein